MALTAPPSLRGGIGDSSTLLVGPTLTAPPSLRIGIGDFFHRIEVMALLEIIPGHLSRLTEGLQDSTVVLSTNDISKY